MEKFLNTVAFVGGIAIMFMGFILSLAESIGHVAPSFIEPTMKITLVFGGCAVLFLLLRRTMADNNEVQELKSQD
jgi:nitrate reductase gamma subunit